MSNRRRADIFTHHEDHANSQNKHSGHLKNIETSNTQINTHLDTFSGHANNNLGFAATKLQVFPYAKDAGNSIMRPLSCDASGRLECSVDALEVSMAQVNLNTDQLEAKVDAVTAKLDSFAGGGNNTVGEGQTKLQIFNYGKDGSTYRPMVVDSSGHLQVDVLTTALPSGGSTAAKQDVQEVTLDAILAKNTQLETLLTAIDSDSNAIKVSSAALVVDAAASEVLLTQLDVVADASLVKHTNNETLLTAISADGNNIQTLLTQLDVVADASLVKHTNNETLLTAISADGNNVQTLLTQLDVVADASLVKHTNNETLLTNSEAHLGNIETSVQLIDDVVGADGSTGPAKCISVGGTESGGNIQELLVDSAGHLQIDVLSAPSTAVTHSALTKLDGAINLDKLDVVVTNSPVLGAGSAAIGKLAANSGVDIGDVDVTSLPLTFNSGNKGSSTQRIVLATDDIPIALVNTKLEAGNVLLGTIDSDTDAIKTSAAAIATDIAANEILITASNALLTTIDSDTNDIKTSVQLLDNAVDGNYININQNIAGSDVASNSGNKSAATQRIVIATDDIPIALVNTKLQAANVLLGTIDSDTDAIKTSAAAIATDIAANEILITASNALLTTIDSDTDAIKTSAAAIATDIAANEILITASNALLTTIDSDTNDIKTSIQVLDDIVLAEDAAHSSGQKGVMTLAVRNDIAESLGADNDYQPLQVDGYGALYTVNNANWSAPLQHFNASIAASGGSNTGNVTNIPTTPNSLMVVECIATLTSGGGTGNSSYTFEVLGAIESGGLYKSIRGNINDEGGAQVSFVVDVPAVRPFLKFLITNNHSAAQTFVVRSVRHGN